MTTKEAMKTYRLPEHTTEEDLGCRWEKVLRFGSRVLLAGHHSTGRGKKPCYFGAVYEHLDGDLSCEGAIGLRAARQLHARPFSPRRRPGGTPPECPGRTRPWSGSPPVTGNAPGDIHKNSPPSLCTLCLRNELLSVRLRVIYTLPKGKTTRKETERRIKTMTRNTERINALFEELVPLSGKADSLAGELVRAVSRIGHRYFNDGDKLGIGYGKETCNAAGRFLMRRGGKEAADLCIAERRIPHYRKLASHNYSFMPWLPISLLRNLCQG